MKVQLGKPSNFLSCNLLDFYLDLRYGVGTGTPENLSLVERTLEHIENKINKALRIVNLHILPEPTVKVKIEPWDTWDFRETLTPIIIPMLLQLKNTQHGAPLVDREDVPSFLQVKLGTDNDPYIFERWEWILDEMVYAFASRSLEKADMKRAQNGFELFGKYFQALWD